MTDGDEVWQKLASEKARGAEHDSNESRPFSECLPGTRIDLLNTLEETLTQEGQKIVWLFGGSGSGKSSIAHSIAERLHSKDCLAATFFFSRKHISRSNTDHVLITIAYQIGLIHHRAKEVIVKAIRDDPELLSSEKSRRRQFESLVATPLRELRLVWGASRAMIFDAADEGMTGNTIHIKDLVYMFTELVRDPTIPISAIFFTSRPLPSLESLTKRMELSDVIVPLRVESFDASRDVEIFLRHSFRDIYEMRDMEFVHPWPWPPEVILAALLSQIKGQFIVAATISRLVRDASDPSISLNVVSSLYTGNVSTLDLELGNIDMVYHYILSDCEPRARRIGVECLSDIVALAEPLSLLNICKLSARDIRKCITHLSAVVLVPPIDSSATVQTYHTSLRDYLSDSSRSGEHHVDPAESHRRLVFWCLTLMQRELKKDICGLGDPSKFHTESVDFESKRDASISGALRYACLYWSYHFERAGRNAYVQKLTVNFLQNQLLFWLEASSVLGCFHLAMACLTDVRRVMSGWERSDHQELGMKLLYDAWRLALHFSEPIQRSALQLYESALPMCPLTTQLRLTYQDFCARSTISVDSGLNNDWDYVIRTFEGITYTSFVTSPDGRRLATLSREEGLKLWDTVTGAFVASFDPQLFPARVAFSYNGSMLACQFRDGRVYLWYPQSSSVLNLLQRQIAVDDPYAWSATCACALAHDCSLLASASCHAKSTKLTIHLFDYNATSQQWLPRPPVVLPGIRHVDTMLFSRTGFVIIVTNADGTYILNPANHSVSRHIDHIKLSFPHWHSVTHAGDASLHVEQIGPSGRACQPPYVIPFGQDMGGDGTLSRATAAYATPLTLPSRNYVDAVLIEDYIYTRDRQIHLFQHHGHTHTHFLLAVASEKKILIVDLSLLLTTLAHQEQHLKDSEDGLRLLCSRPDRREAVIARHLPERSAILQTTAAMEAGWNVTTLSGSICDAPELISVSYNMDMVSYIDTTSKTIHLYGVGGQERCVIPSETPLPSKDVKRHEFSPKSTYFSLAANERLWVWFSRNGSLVGTVYHLLQTLSYAFAFSEDETRLAVTQCPGVITIFAVGDCLTLIGHFDLPDVHPKIDIYVAFIGSGHDIHVLVHSDDCISLWRYKAETRELARIASQERRRQFLKVSVLSSPHMHRFRFCDFIHHGSSVDSDTINICTTPDGATGDGGMAQFVVDSTGSQTTIVDLNTWSNVSLDGGWLRVNSRRICWLSPKYRPVPQGDGISVFAERVVLQVPAPRVNKKGIRSIVLHLRGVDIHYYDWSNISDCNIEARKEQVHQNFLDSHRRSRVNYYIAPSEYDEIRSPEFEQLLRRRLDGIA